jgi:hypothetical protein
MRKIFGHEREELTGGWRKLHKEEIMICTVKEIKSRRMR